MQGRIIKSLGGFYYVETSENIYETKARGIFRKDNFKPVAGDICDISIMEDGKGVIEKIYERKNYMLRPAIANIDILYMVVSTQEPIPNYLVLDKMITIAEYKNIDPMIVITKTDMGDYSQIQDIYSKSGFRTFLVDYDNLDSVNNIRKSMIGKLSAFCGNSGVGKSTLLNAIDGRLDIKTSHISQKLGRGRHTTRDVCLYPIEEGGYIADTPGFSSVELSRFENISSDQLKYCFREFSEYDNKCKFMDCNHLVEKGCAIIDAVERGSITKSRHNSYKALFQEQLNIEKNMYKNKKNK